MNHRINSATLITAVTLVSCLLWPASKSFAQFLPISRPTSCDVANEGRECLLIINRQAPRSPGKVTVWGSNLVTIEIVNKSPLEGCHLDGKSRRSFFGFGGGPKTVSADLSTDGDMEEILELTRAGSSLATRRSSGAAPGGFEKSGVRPEIDSALDEFRRLTSVYRAT